MVLERSGGGTVQEGVANGGVTLEPAVEVVGTKYERHAVVHRDDVLARGGCDDTTRQEVRSGALIAPPFKETRQEKGFTVAAGEVVGKFESVGIHPPFVVSVHRNDAGAFGEGLAKRGLLRDGFGASVRESSPLGGAPRPTRDETPGVGHELSFLLDGAHHEEGALGREIPTRGPLVVTESRERLRETSESARRAKEGDSTAHVP